MQETDCDYPMPSPGKEQPELVWGSLGLRRGQSHLVLRLLNIPGTAGCLGKAENEIPTPTPHPKAGSCLGPRGKERSSGWSRGDSPWLDVYRLGFGLGLGLVSVEAGSAERPSID